MNFLACDGDWLLSPDGSPVCSGSLVAVTRGELQANGGSALTWEQVAELQGEIVILFALVFGFLILKKSLK